MTNNGSPTSSREGAQNAQKTGVIAGSAAAQSKSTAEEQHSRVSPTGSSSEGTSSGGEQSTLFPARDPVTVNMPLSTSVANANDKELSVGEIKEYDELTVDEVEGKLDRDMLTPGERKSLEEELERRRGTEPATKVDKQQNDPDEPKPEEDKFDIQQGDFIEFLMKDIVLASAAWAGKKVSGYAGLWMYKGLSKAYHFTGDKLNKGWDAVTEAYKNGKSKFQTFCTSRETNKLLPEKLTGSGEKTEYAKKIIEMHNQYIDRVTANLKIRDVALEAFAKRIFLTETEGIEKEYRDFNGETVWYDKKTGAFVPVDSPIIKKMISSAAEARKNIKESGKPEAEQKAALEAFANHFSHNMREVMLLDAQSKIFSANYACATMLQHCAEGNSGADIMGEYQKLQSDGKLIFYTGIKKLRKNQEICSAKTVEDFVAVSDRANKEAFDNINRKDGNVSVNKDLISLNAVATGRRQNSDTPQSLLDAAMDNQELANLSARLDACNQNLAREQAAANERRKQKSPAQDHTASKGRTSTTLNEGGGR